MNFSTPRQRPSPSTSSTPGSSRRPPVPHLAFSPLGSHTGSIRSVSAQSVPSYQPSTASSSFPNTQATRYLSNASVAPSQIGSVATTANPAGSARFRRGHVRNKANAQPPPGVSSNNPDLVDLMALEEPDVVFRMFGVRDVRKIEQRASDAANAKVAELRTMVGERYRDLLAAADSIVRMRGAADKLLDRLEGVESAVMSAGDAIHDPTPQRRPSLIAHQADSINSRTLSSPPTLSLTLHLFLNLSSLVHSLIEQHKFLPAARLENLGRVVWQELEEFKPENETGVSEGEQQKSVKEMFPIVARHHEGMGQLGPLIVRRATAELRSSNLPSLVVAQTLASLVLLDHASLSSSLDLFLKARSHALSSLLAVPRPSTSKPSPSTSDAQLVQSKIEKVLDCVLKTVEAVDTIFSSEKPLLPQLLRELEHPSSAAPSSSSDLNTPRLEPILTTLPNFPTLSRHLPNSILSYNPFLSSTSSSMLHDAITQALAVWLESSTTALLAGVDEWITSLSTSENTALTLSSLRDSINSQLSSVPPSSASQAQTLQSKLLELIESRLSQVYILKLSQLVSNLSPSLYTLLSKLSTKEYLAENDSSRFLFSIEMPHLHQQAVASKYSDQRPHHQADPFGTFLTKVGKRVDGRTPLVDLGLEELEKSAREIRGDLKSWLSEDASGPAMGERELRKRYVSEVEKTLESLVDVLEQVLEGEEKNEEEGIPNSLFIGTFARHLSLSPTFTRDLLLGVPPSPPTMLKTWQSRLATLQARSLRLWQETAVRRAIEILRKGTDKSVASRDYSNQTSALPTGPSTYLLQSLNSLLHSLHALPLHRLHANPSPATSLLEEFSKEALTVAGEFLELLRGMEGGEEIKSQIVWDVTLIGIIVGESEDREKWEMTTTKFQQLLSSAEAPSREDFASSTTTYLLRTQSIYSPLFPSPSPLPLSAPVDPRLHRSTSRLLPLGAPPAASQGEFKSLVGVVQPGQRLNLLPTKV